MLVSFVRVECHKCCRCCLRKGWCVSFWFNWNGR